jgi:hypothetical protein
MALASHCEALYGSAEATLVMRDDSTLGNIVPSHDLSLCYIGRTEFFLQNI